MSVNPVFFDESGRRWRIARWLLIALLTGIVSFPTIFVISTIRIERVPAVFENSGPNANTAADRIAQFGPAAAKHRLRQ
jgi:hypothetical protein